MLQCIFRKSKSVAENNNTGSDELEIYWYPKIWKSEGGREVHFSTRHALTFRSAPVTFRPA
jgi:hypothetical protein